MTHEVTINMTRKQWEAIQASFGAELRKGYSTYNEELINKYDFAAGTNPYTFVFEFDDGFHIYLDWYVEEFGGVVRWTSNDGTDEGTIDDFELDAVNEFMRGIDRYFCKINIVEEE